MGDRKEQGEGKKLLIVYILQILQRFSDEDHPLSQQRILELLEEEYRMGVDRKSVRRNLLRLQEAGLSLYCREVDRVIRGKKESLSLDWYWGHSLTAGDLHTLLDVLYFSRLPQQRVRQLADKLAACRSRYFDDEKKAVRNLPDGDYQPLLEKQKSVTRLVSEAIGSKKKIHFYYDHYEADGKWHHDRLPGGEERLHKINPYQILAAGGLYFLLGNDDGEEKVRIYRVSRMSGVEILEEAARPQKTVSALENGIYPAQHLTMGAKAFLGEAAACTMDVAPEALTECLEDLGKSVRVLSATASWIQIEAQVPLSLASAWALSQGSRVKVTGPPLLVRQMKQAAAALHKTYGGD